MINKNEALKLDLNLGLVELNPEELKNTEGGVIVLAGLAAYAAGAAIFAGGVALGAAIGYGSVKLIDAME